MGLQNLENSKEGYPSFRSGIILFKKKENPSFLVCTGHIVPFWTKRQPDGAEQNHETSFVLATLQLQLSFGLLTAKGWSCHRNVGIRLTWAWTVAPRQTAGLSTQ